MNKRIILCALILFAFSLFVSAAEIHPVNAVIYPIDSPIYSDMDALYSLCGLVTPSGNRPWSDSEARMILDRVDPSSLTGVARRLYDEILSVLDKGLRWKCGPDFQMDTGLEIGLEMYAHSDSEHFTAEDDWERGYQERKACSAPISNSRHGIISTLPVTSIINGAGRITMTVSEATSQTDLSLMTAILPHIRLMTPRIMSKSHMHSLNHSLPLSSLIR